jgi:hypothetical protein
MRSTILLLFAVVVIAQAPSFKPKPIGNLKQVMRSIPLPNSDLIFAVQGKAPADDKGWQAVENAAIAISETATLITMPARVRSNGQPVPGAACRLDQVRPGTRPRRTGLLQSGAVEEPGRCEQLHRSAIRGLRQLPQGVS